MSRNTFCMFDCSARSSNSLQPYITRGAYDSHIVKNDGEHAGSYLGFCFTSGLCATLKRNCSTIPVNEHHGCIKRLNSGNKVKVTLYLRAFANSISIVKEDIFSRKSESMFLHNV